MTRGRDLTDGDVVRALSVLPDPYFRNRDAYDAAVALGFRPHVGQAIWVELLRRGWIERSDRPIGRARRWRYWIRRGARRA